jgi:hypothetical protein
MIIAILTKIYKFFTEYNLQSRLESYIVANNPKSEADVERLTRDFLRKYYYL